MGEKKDLLVEIGTEELPPRALLSLSEAFQEQFQARMNEKGLEFEKIVRFATPRRLALRVVQLDAAQAAQTMVRKGPSVKAAFDAEGKPTKAAEGFARSCGVDVNDLAREESEKGTWLVYQLTKPGKRTAELIPDMVRESLNSLPIPKRMRWSDLDSEFVRPVHWVVLLFGSDPIVATILDVEAGNQTRGHRFHHPQPISIEYPLEYEQLLRDVGYVEADFFQRRERIRGLVERAAAASAGTAVIDPELLDEVTALTEWPVAVLGSFDEEFLELPAEALIETMQKHQKYFPVVDSEGRLRPEFITVSNIESTDSRQVRAGNERVIRPRFKDASFFWEQDLKRPLAELRPALDKIVFQRELGTLGDKTNRIGLLAVAIAGKIGLDPNLAERSAELCKCDLLTYMVGEFADLQGTMGRYYAGAGGEHECVCKAMEEQYLPRHAGDSLPQSPCGQALAIADRVDSLLGIFAIGQRPTGVKDPYALRRASLGVMRILIETPLELDLHNLLQLGSSTLRKKVGDAGVVEEVYDYMIDRLHGYYGARGISGDVVEAVLATRSTVPVDIDRRIRAVAAFKRLSEASSLAAANKRIRNILRKSAVELPEKIDRDQLHEESERALYSSIAAVKEEINPLMEQREYAKALTRLANLKPAVDEFFDNVMVLCEDEKIRMNRLALLRSLSVSFRNIADISRLSW